MQKLIYSHVESKSSQYVNRNDIHTAHRNLRRIKCFKVHVLAEQWYALPNQLRVHAVKCVTADLEGDRHVFNLDTLYIVQGSSAQSEPHFCMLLSDVGD